MGAPEAPATPNPRPGLVPGLTLFLGRFRMKSPTALIIRRSSKGYTVSGQFRSEIGKRYKKILMRADSRQELKTCLRDWLAINSVPDRDVDRGGM